MVGRGESASFLRGRRESAHVGFEAEAYDTQTMWIRFVTFAVWMVAAASAAAWLLPQWRSASGADGSSPAPVAMERGVPPADWGPALTHPQASPGAAAPPTDAALDAARFKLVGVAGPLKPNGQGVALLSVDGKPAQAYAVGEQVAPQRVVQEVSAHMVRIGVPGGAPTVTLQVPLLPPPAEGVRPPPG